MSDTTTATPDATGTPVATAPGTATPAPAAAVGGAPSGTPDAKAPAADSLLAPKTETKPEGGEKAEAEAKPEAELELKLPEGRKMDEATLGEFKALAKEAGLTGDQAQKGLDFFLKAESAWNQQSQQHWSDLRKEWTEQAKNDKEYGGDKFGASVLAAQKAVAQFGGESLSKLLAETGLDNHPEVVRAFVRIGKAIGDDTVAGTASGGGSTADDGEAGLRQLYNHPTSQQLFRKG